MKYIVHANKDGSFSVIDVSKGCVVSTYRGEHAAREAYTLEIKMDKAKSTEERA
jgi:hypothetical protein